MYTRAAVAVTEVNKGYGICIEEKCSGRECAVGSSRIIKKYKRARWGPAG